MSKSDKVGVLAEKIKGQLLSVAIPFRNSGVISDTLTYNNFRNVYINIPRRWAMTELSQNCRNS